MKVMTDSTTHNLNAPESIKDAASTMKRILSNFKVEHHSEQAGTFSPLVMT